MFGISFSEIVLILVISLIIFGPKQLPEIASKAGRLFFIAQHFFVKIKQEIYQHSGLNELNQVKQDITHTYNQIKSSIIANPTYADNQYGQPHNDTQLHQAELEFDRQPELFDQ